MRRILFAFLAVLLAIVPTACRVQAESGSVFQPKLNTDESVWTK